MPPKKKGGIGKTGKKGKIGKKGKGGKKGKKGKKKGKRTVINGINSGEMTKEQLEDHVIRLREELEREREERNYFQLERDKLNTFWEITKHQLEERRTELRNKEREIEESDEQHQTEMKVYKQKIKHLMYGHSQKVGELQILGVSNLKLTDENNRTEQTHLRMDNRVLRCDIKEQQLANENKIKDLKLSHESEITEIRLDFERQLRELEAKFYKKMEVQRDEMDLRRKNEIHELEERKNYQINTLIKNHERSFSEMKNYYNDITLNNLALINTLKEQMEDMTHNKERQEKTMGEIMFENRRMGDPLKKAQDENKELKRLLHNYEKDKLALQNTKIRLKIRNKEMRDVEFIHEVLEERFEKVQEERDGLYKKFIYAIHEVQQKSGLKNLLLERKLSSLNESLEKKEAQLNEVLSASNLDPSALTIVTKKLEDVLDSKNGAIKDLQYELARVCKAHNDQLRTYESKLEEFGVPVEELGFQPLESIMGNQTIGYGPTGMISVPP